MTFVRLALVLIWCAPSILLGSNEGVKIAGKNDSIELTNLVGWKIYGDRQRLVDLKAARAITLVPPDDYAEKWVHVPTTSITFEVESPRDLKRSPARTGIVGKRGRKIESVQTLIGRLSIMRMRGDLADYYFAEALLNQDTLYTTLTIARGNYEHTPTDRLTRDYLTILKGLRRR